MQSKASTKLDKELLKKMPKSLQVFYDILQTAKKEKTGGRQKK